MKTEINKKCGIVALLFTVCSAISLISAVAYLITSADGALYNVLALVWLVTIASGCVLAVFSHGPRWVSFVYLSCVILYGLLHIVSSYLLMIAMGAMSAGGMAYILLRGLPVCMIFASGLPYGHYGDSEEAFLGRLDEMVEQAFDDQCTGTNPRYPLMKEIKEMYLNAYYGG